MNIFKAARTLWFTIFKRRIIVNFDMAENEKSLKINDFKLLNKFR